MAEHVPPLTTEREFKDGRPRALTDDQVWEIRAEYLKGGISIYRLARIYRVSRATIYAALRGEKAYEGV